MAFVGLLPLICGLLRYYFAGGIGNSWFSKIFIGLILLISILLPIIEMINYLILSGEAQRIVGLLLIFLYFPIVLSPVIFTVIAFVVNEVNLWKRLIPLLAFIFYLLIHATLGGVSILATLYLDLDGIVFRGIGESTIPQWLLLGSIAWSLLSLPAFSKNKKIGEEEKNIPPSPQEYLLENP